MEFKLYKKPDQTDLNILILKGLNDREKIDNDLIFVKSINLSGNRVFDFNEKCSCGKIAWDLKKKQLCTI